MIKKRTQCDKIDWNNIKVSFTWADPKKPNPLNPNSKLTAKQREKKIIAISARIWGRQDWFFLRRIRSA